LKQFYTFR